MAPPGETIVDISDNDDDDDCIIQSVIYKSKGYYNINYDHIYKDNPLLAEVIEKSLHLESSEGMLRVINETLLKVYHKADWNYKCSTEFETLLKKTLINLDKNPSRKFAHLLNLSEILRSRKFKKRAPLVTLEKKIKKASFKELASKRKSSLERRNKKQNIDVVDLDKYQEVPIIINLDENDTVNDGLKVIYDEKENNSDNTTYCIEINLNEPINNDKIDGCVNNQNNNNLNCLSNVVVNEDCFIEINDDDDEHGKDQNANGFSESSLVNNSENGNSFDDNMEDDLILCDSDQIEVSSSQIHRNNSENGNSHKDYKEDDLNKCNSDQSEVTSSDIYKNKNCPTKGLGNAEVSKTNDIEKKNQENKGSVPCVLNNVKNTLHQNKEDCTSFGSPENLLVVHKSDDLNNKDKSPTDIRNSQRIQDIEGQIARFKKMIIELDVQEVNDDNCYRSPYIKSEKYKEQIVKLYKELCELTGTQAIKRRKVKLTVIEGHPSGPVRRLERFLNENIGEDGNPPFPDFSDVVKCVETANTEHKLGWNMLQVMREANALFIHCGRALQKRRQKREWHDLRSRVKGEDYKTDPADSNPELQAQLEANRRVGVKREADLLDRYSLMQIMLKERRNTTHVDSSNENNIQQVMSRIPPTRELDFNQVTNVNIDQRQNNSELRTNICSDLVQNDSPGMPQIIAGSVQSACFTDEFGFKIINDCNGNSNEPINFASNIANISNDGEGAGVISETHNSKQTFQTHDTRTNSGEIDFEKHIVPTTLAVHLNAEASCESSVQVNLETNTTNRIHVSCLTFEEDGNSNSDLLLNNLELSFEPEVINTETDVKANLKFIRDVVGSSETNSKVDFNEANVKIDTIENIAEIEPTENTAAIDPIENIAEIEPAENIVEIDPIENIAEIEPAENIVEIDPIENIAEIDPIENIANIEPTENIAEVESAESIAKIEPTENIVEIDPIENIANIEPTENIGEIDPIKNIAKIEPTENIAKVLNDFGEDYTVSIFDIEDPFLIVEISDSSDDED